MSNNNGSSPRRVIGGGLSGLAAAINFAKNDEKVETAGPIPYNNLSYPVV